MRTRIACGELNRAARVFGKLALLAAVASACGQSQIAGELDQRVIAAGKKADGNTLDRQLPHRRFDEWLQEQVGAAVRIQWESNDCGAQDGSNRREDFPICAEAMVKFPAGGKLGVQLVVGSLRKGVHGQPAVGFLYAEDKSGRLYRPRGLSELPELLTKLRK